ncbi:hypothetical protein [Fredinandcohnia quinoae]|uniref:N-acetyltransferase domain-containing protein n=1 Tax=Fredinandcohnia quinoae TaxID=2918902 RepID=A0AAW5E1M8_9BACI|nr:hypothetical protein [Fredinandcohnia sp. SECRCQ15]MCH1625469.1 hypothetical protein [Fredinandcohnia sp. SECRCQ15]
MYFESLLEEENLTKSRSEVQKDLEELQFQMFRMQENIKEISKRHQIIGIDQTKEEKWVIVSALDDGRRCQIMLNDCVSAYRGKWEFSLHAKYIDDNVIHIGDIRGPANQGYGSICINYLKDIAIEQNMPTITGDIAQRDWDHLDRLVYFYTKHDFDVEIDHETKSGEIIWSN